MPRNIDIFLIYTYRSVSSDMAHNSIFGAQTAHTKASRYVNKCPCAWTKVISKKLCPRGHKKHSAHTASASLYSLFKNHTANFTMSRTERLTEPHSTLTEKEPPPLSAVTSGRRFSCRYIKIYRCNAIITKVFYFLLWGGNHDPLKMLLSSYSGISK